MKRISSLMLGAIAQLASVVAEPIPVHARADPVVNPVVDLGYAVYQGELNSTTQVTSFKGYFHHCETFNDPKMNALLQGTICSTTCGRSPMGTTTSSSDQQIWNYPCE